jgi:hypothetical protein
LSVNGRLPLNSEGAELVNGLLGVSGRRQLFEQPGLLELFPETRQHLASFRAPCKGLRHRLGGQHTGLHGRVAALDLGHVEKARIVTDQQPTRHRQLRQGCEPPFDDGPGTIGHPGTSLEHLGEQWMVLEALKLVDGLV